MGFCSALFIIVSSVLLYGCRMDSKPNLRVEAGELVLRASQGAGTAEKVHISQVAKVKPFVLKP